MKPSKSDQDKVLHEIDGIQEYDNNLPNWWLYLFGVSIVFAFGYWFVYQTGKFADLPLAAYEAELDKEAEAKANDARLVGPVTAEALGALAKDPAAVGRGQRVFTTTCAPCHRADGAGVVGPNLTDDFWLHGGAPEKIYKTIHDGVADKGMPAWGPQLGPERVQSVTAYVMSLRGTHVAGGKAPQGDPEPLSANP